LNDSFHFQSPIAPVALLVWSRKAANPELAAVEKPVSRFTVGHFGIYPSPEQTALDCQNADVSVNYPAVVMRLNGSENSHMSYKMIYEDAWRSVLTMGRNCQ
jgi:hypothetical protein